MLGWQVSVPQRDTGRVRDQGGQVVWWNVVSEEGWREWVGRCRRFHEANKVLEAGEEEVAEQFMPQAKAVVMMVVSREAGVKEPLKLAEGEGQDGRRGKGEDGLGRGMKRRRLSVHGDYADWDIAELMEGDEGMVDGGPGEIAVVDDADDEDDGVPNVEARDEQVGVIMIYKHEYDDLVERVEQMESLKKDLLRMIEEVERLKLRV